MQNLQFMMSVMRFLKSLQAHKSDSQSRSVSAFESVLKFEFQPSNAFLRPPPTAENPSKRWNTAKNGEQLTDLRLYGPIARSNRTLALPPYD